MRIEGAFNLTPNPEAYIPRAATERCLAELEDWALRGEAPVAILAAPSGAGKTFMLRMLESRTRDRFRGVYVPNPIFGPREMALWALDAVGTPAQQDHEATLLQVADDLRREGSGLLLLVDDVELLPTPTEEWLLAKAAEHMRVVLSVADGGWRDRLVAHAGEGGRLIQLSGALSFEETRDFVLAQLERIGASDAVRALFDDTALRALHERAEGVPVQVQNEAAMLLHEASTRRTSPETSFSLARGIVSVGSDFGEDVAEDGPAVATAPPTEREQRERTRWLEIGGAFALGLLVAWIVATWDGSQPGAPPPTAASTPAAPVAEAEPAPPVAPTSVDSAPPVARTATAPAAPPVARSTAPPETAAVARSTAPPETAAVARSTAPPPDAAAAARSTASPAATAVARSAAPAATPVARSTDSPPETAAVARAAAPAPSPVVARAAAKVLVGVNARPWGVVFVDGEKLGETPLAEVPLPAGRHRFAVRMADGRWIEREVEISETRRHLSFE